MKRFLQSRLLLALAPIFLAACGQDESELTPQLQIVGAPRDPYTVGATSAQRFPKYGTRNGRLRFIPGSTWAKLRSSQFRTLNFAFGPDNIGECYLSEVSGFLDGGLENINRWYGQMGLEEIDAADLAKLPRKPFAGNESVFVKLDGSFTGMGDVPKEGYRMLAMIFMRDCEAYSVKMVGPAFLLDREESEFLAFCETLEIAPDPDREPYMQAKVGPFEFLRPCAWDFVVPDSDEKVRRPIGFEIGPKAEVKAEMGIIVEGGEASPIMMANKWRASDNLPALTEEEFAALPDQVLMGSRGKLLDYQVGNVTFVGIVSQLAAGGHAPMTVVATMKGPAEIVTPEKTLFRAFAETLRLRPAQPTENSPH